MSACNCEVWPEFYDTVQRVARKEHKCDECQGVIPKGTKYHYGAGKTDGDFWWYKLCLKCDEDWSMLEGLWDNSRSTEDLCRCIGELSEMIELALDYGFIEEAVAGGILDEEHPFMKRWLPHYFDIEKEVEVRFEDPDQLKLPL